MNKQCSASDCTPPPASTLLLGFSETNSPSYTSEIFQSDVDLECHIWQCAPPMSLRSLLQTQGRLNLCVET